jgi:crossover junction endodeoxyribonuclease RuvC
MTIILGIDPGSVKTGFGLISVEGQKHRYITSGIIRLPKAPVPERLKVLAENLNELIEEYRPTEASVEEVFLAKNPSSAIKLGQARGGAITVCVAQDLQVAEYTAKQIKQAVVGYGSADKMQVQQMVKTLLSLAAMPAEDAADALAAAICHANSRNNSLQAHSTGIALAGRMRKGRMS